MSGGSRPGFHPQSMPPGAASIRKTPVCRRDGPAVAKANAHPFRCGGPGFKESVHRSANLIKTPLGKLEPFWSSKLDEVRVDGEPHHAFGPAFTPRFVRRSDEPTQGQGFLSAIGLHSFHIVGYLTRECYGVFTPHW